MTPIQLRNAQFHPQFAEYDESDYDDFYSAEDYDRHRQQRDGWQTDVWDGR